MNALQRYRRPFTEWCFILDRIAASALVGRRICFWVLLFASATTAASGPSEQAGASARFGAEAGPLLTIAPAVGFRFGAENTRVTFALPWSVQFGSLSQRDAGEGLRPFRAVLEPGLAM